ncbi:MAG TPA: S8 family peptidase [Longimicrobium sp.]|nr:S8 family peptidase [Longimicrobium sp.]
MPHKPLPRAGLVGFTLLAIGLAACTDAPVAPTATPRQATEARAAARGEPIPGQYIVLFKDGVPDVAATARGLAAAHGGRVLNTWEHAVRGFSVRIPDAAAEALRRNPHVASVTQDQRVRIADVQTNPTWGLDRIDQRDLPLSNSYTYNNNGAGVTVYVIDTGIQTSHPQFGGRASIGFDAYGGNGQDCHGHGTHVAGTVGSTTYGVAKGVTLIGVRVLDCNGFGDWNLIITGINWVTAHHQAGQPAVANMSLGGYMYEPADQAVANSIADGITYAIAAGNAYGDDACYYTPARVAGALTVGATASNDWRADFSNVGTCLDLFAPGAAITSTWIGSGVETIDGTSMASPHVAGAAARYLQANPTATPAQVNAAIIAAATTGKVQDARAGSPNRLLYVDPGSVVTPPGNEDTFNSNTLGNWTIYNTPGAWSISGGFLHGSDAARQSVVIRNGVSLSSAFVEAETDQASDGGLVLRFQSSGNYYLMAIRDDSWYGHANVEIYRASGGSFTRIAGPVNLAWTRGVKKTARFEASGSTLRAYLDGALVLTATDATYASGGLGVRHDNTHVVSGITTRYDVVRWGQVVSVDNFDGTSLGNYTLYNTASAWSMSGGWLNAGTSARQSVAIRNGATIANGYVETETDQASDGGLVLRFQSNGNYYLMALRDDSRFGHANIEIYRASGGSFTRIAGPVDLTWIRGVRKSFRFEGSGSTLRAYVDGAVVLTATDGTYTSGGFGVRHDNTRAEAGITSRFDLLRWANN